MYITLIVFWKTPHFEPILKKKSETSKFQLKKYRLALAWEKCLPNETSLLRRLQAQTLPDATRPIGKIHPFRKIAITFEPLMGF